MIQEVAIALAHLAEKIPGVCRSWQHPVMQFDDQQGKRVDPARVVLEQVFFGSFDDDLHDERPGAPAALVIDKRVDRQDPGLARDGIVDPVGKAPLLAFQAPGSIGASDGRAQDGDPVSAVGLARQRDIVFIRLDGNDARLRIGFGEELGRNPAVCPTVDDKGRELLRNDGLVPCVELVVPRDPFESVLVLVKDQPMRFRSTESRALREKNFPFVRS